jgi:hypothetical protein
MGASAFPLLESIREGMTVVDAANHKLGTVSDVQFGDPQAVTTQGNEFRDTGLVGDLARAFTDEVPGPDVPDPLRKQLLRYGYIAIDGGFGAGTRYARADKVQAVRGDTVVLAVTRDQLSEED